jgi:hypothetical protein
MHVNFQFLCVPTCLLTMLLSCAQSPRVSCAAMMLTTFHNLQVFHKLRELFTTWIIIECNYLLFIYFLWLCSPVWAHPWGLLITHYAPQSVGLLQISDQLTAETSTRQHKTHTTNIHAPGGFQTHYCSRWAAVDLRHGLCGHWVTECNTNQNVITAMNDEQTTTAYKNTITPVLTL